MIDVVTSLMAGLLILPLLAAIICWLVPGHKAAAMLNMVVSVTLFFAAAGLGYMILSGEPAGTIGKLFRADALSVYFAMTITFIYVFVSWFSISFMEKEKKMWNFSDRRIRAFYALMLLFTATMIIVVLSDNLGMMWVALEATTLTSGILVAFNGSKEAIAAAWKYLILCTVGIALGLFGTVLTYFAAVSGLGESTQALNWSYLITIAGQLDPAIMKVAFAFILVGYGTKVGLAPLHSWLPDAHSQAPAPVSAMLSGTLLGTALYGIVRFNSISQISLDGGLSNPLLIAFGIFSVIFATLLILTQKEFKRVLAYSSIEHMGIIAIGIGIGHKVALFGALLHFLTHAISKSMLFLASGSIYQMFGSRRIDDINGLLRGSPLLGTAVFIGVLAIAGSPPFGTFVSEVAVIYGSFLSGQYIIGIIIALAVIVVFSALLFGVGKMTLGEKRENADGTPTGHVSERSYRSLFILMIILMIVLGPLLPSPVVELVNRSVDIVLGGVLGG